MFEQTIWGPLVDRDHRGRRRAYRWVAHDPEAINLALMELEGADGLEAAHGDCQPRRDSGPELRRRGRLGPHRLDDRRADPATRGPRRLDPDVVGQPASTGGSAGCPRGRCRGSSTPASGRLWTANNRVVGGEALDLLGDGGYGNGARARQIRDDLLAIEKASERDLLAVQLDDRALYLARWHDRALAALTPVACASSPRRAELRRVLETTWTGRASVEGAAYRLVRDFRLACARRALEPLTLPCKKVNKDFSVFDLRQLEGPLWTLLDARPAHLLDAAYASWSDLELAALDEVAAAAVTTSGSLDAHTWGRRNTTRIRHPLSGALPGLSRLLDMPALQLPGDSNMPRVQSPTFGASERLVVSPGREAEGIFHMPAGQSGHPLSPFYRAGHEAWARGDATPLLPGPTRHTLTLTP